MQHGTYRIERVLGQGGFGITYLAIDVNLQRQVAVKEFFPRDYCDRDESTSHVTVGTKNSAELVNRLKAKFLKEARNIAKFDNPNIIRIYAAFEENDTAYYVMEYIEGESLSAMVKQQGPISEPKALEYIRKVGSALEYVHARKINHLDVKPANIMVRRSDNNPILIDFGLSKQYDTVGNQTSTTPIGVSHGYAPLEQYTAEGVKDFSPQSDLYSLAATLYYLLSGVVPPQATTLVEEQLTFPGSIPSRLVAPLSKAMSSARHQRHETIGHFIEALKDRTSVPTHISTHLGQPVYIRTLNPSEKEPDLTDPEPSNNRKWYIGGFVGIAVIVIAVWWFGLPKGGENPNPPNPPVIDSVEKVTDHPSLESKLDGLDGPRGKSVNTVKDMYYTSSLGPCSYTGEVDEDGKPHGQGVSKWESGLGKSYDGQWEHGEMQGKCVYESSSGYRFEGRFSQGHYNNGKLISPDKSYYVGSFDKNGNKWTGTEYDKYGNQIDTWKNGE